MRSKWVILGAPLQCAECTEEYMCEDCYAAVSTEEHHARENGRDSTDETVERVARETGRAVGWRDLPYLEGK